MKSFLMTVLLIVGSQAFANVELGKYRAVDADSGSIQANFELKAGGAVTFSVAASGTTINCNGTYNVQGKRFNASLTCNSPLVSQANVSIDITNVNAQSIRTARGAEVDVVIDALGADATKFLLKKAD